jgi:hypothetical protein
MTSILEVEQLDTLSSNASSTLTIGGTNTTTIAFGPNVTTTPSSLANTPAFFAKQGSSQTISSLTWTKMDIDTEIFDSDSTFDTATNRFTPAVAGKYFIYGQVNISGGSTNTLVQIAIYKNGSEAYMCVDRYPNGNDIAVNIQVALDLNDTDYVEAYARQSQGVNADVLSNSSFFGAYKIIGA